MNADVTPMNADILVTNVCIVPSGDGVPILQRPHSFRASSAFIGVTSAFIGVPRTFARITTRP
ncbi:MAG: hypothetical protein IPL06_13130 [Betaproteobacteria bacterium]|nr:hypothetical protein [Betaproteobacteria bacterium]